MKKQADQNKDIQSIEGEDKSNIYNPDYYEKPENIADLLRDKEEGIQELEMKTYDEEQKLKELEKDYSELQKIKQTLENNNQNESKPKEISNIIKNFDNTTIDKEKEDRIKREFEEVKKEIDTIIDRFKSTKLANVLGIYSEMEGIEFSWNNYQQTLKIIETFVDALLTAKARISNKSTTLVKIAKEEKPKDNLLAESVKRLSNLGNKPKNERETGENKKNPKDLESIIKQAIEDYNQ